MAPRGSRSVSLVCDAAPGGARVSVTLPAIFEWYCDDFGNTDAQMLQWVAQYMPSSKQKVGNHWPRAMPGLPSPAIGFYFSLSTPPMPTPISATMMNVL